MNEALRRYLLDTSAACRLILQFTTGADYAAYSANSMMSSAVERQIEIIGESLNLALREDPALIDRVPEARRIVGMRNRIIHGYDSVDPLLVWDVVQSKIPPLLDTLDALL